MGIRTSKREKRGIGLHSATIAITPTTPILVSLVSFQHLPLSVPHALLAAPFDFRKPSWISISVYMARNRYPTACTLGVTLVSGEDRVPGTGTLKLWSLLCNGCLVLGELMLRSKLIRVIFGQLFFNSNDVFK